MNQKYSSKNTSVNTKQFPAIYGKINWKLLAEDLRKKNSRYEYGFIPMLDYGSGRENPDIDRIMHENGFHRNKYDPYWISEMNNISALLYPKEVIVCSNVLNVLKEYSYAVHVMLAKMGIPYFITVYEGDGTGIGKQSKPDCWQRNERAKEYLFRDEVLYKGVITDAQWKKYIL